VDDLESHSGAETMPARPDQLLHLYVVPGGLTVLVENVQALLHQQRGIEDYQAVAYGQHVIARPGLEESSDCSLASWLAGCCNYAQYRPCRTKPSNCSRSIADSCRGGSFGGKGARWSKSLGVTKAGRASLLSAFVAESVVSPPLMVVALLLGAA
jgi:hypothetical protein